VSFVKIGTVKPYFTMAENEIMTIMSIFSTQFGQNSVWNISKNFY